MAFEAGGSSAAGDDAAAVAGSQGGVDRGLDVAAVGDHTPGVGAVGQHQMHEGVGVQELAGGVDGVGAEPGDLDRLARLAVASDDGGEVAEYDVCDIYAVERNG